jgi:hypothetical protein
MMRYLKFGDDEDDALPAKDALLRWIQHNTSAYAGVDVKNFTSSFADGLALCALVHKFRPELFDFSKLDPRNVRANIDTALRAAESAFEFERFLTVDEVTMLDEKTMLVFIGELYAKITETFQLMRVGQRLTKLEQFVQRNTELRSQYVHDATLLEERLGKVEALLSDTSFDGTMAGAQQKLSRFNKYKLETEPGLLSSYFQLCSLHTALATRLADHSRPAFVPENAAIRLSALDRRISHLAELEHVESSLHAEMSRQFNLTQLDVQHQARCGKFELRIHNHEQALASYDSISSSGEARMALKTAEAIENVC